MRISVVVPAHNAEKTLRRCVESILQGEKEDVEVILVDDHSTDGTYQQCMDLRNRFPDLKAYSTEKRGVSAARNEGIRHATGEVIGFCDADDMYAAETIATVRDSFAIDPTLDILVVGLYYAHDSSGLQIDGKRVYRGAFECNTEQLWELIMTDGRIMGSTCNKFYRASCVSNIHFDESLSHCEDMHFNCQVIFANPHGKCRILPLPLYYYMFNTESATNNSQKLFNANDEFQYYRAIDRMSTLFSGNREMTRLAEYKKMVLAIDTLLHAQCKERHALFLYGSMEKYAKSFLWSIAKYPGMENLKWAIKWIYLRFIKKRRFLREK